jgi:hypothetical protein
MALNVDIVEAVANANFKTMAEVGVQSTLNHQTRLQILAEKSLGKTLEMMDTTSVPEGLGLAAAQRGDLSKLISELGGAVATIQQLSKTAALTPPPTA